jgi:hypothetical protein
MDVLHEKIFKCLSDSTKTTTQITGLRGMGKTTLLLHIADYYISLGKQILFISYNTNDVSGLINRLDIDNLKSTKLVISYNTDLDALIKIFDKTNIDDNKFVILLDGLDKIPCNKFVGAPLKQKHYLKGLLNDLKKYSSHVIFTNTCFMRFTTHSPEDRGILTTTLKIPVNYTILIDTHFSMDEELSSILVKAKRKNKLSKLNLDI